MVGQLQFKNPGWEDDEEVTFYAASNLAPMSNSLSTSSSSSSTSDLSGNAAGASGTNRANEVLDRLRSRVQSSSARNGNVSNIKVSSFWKRIGKAYTNVTLSIIILVGVSVFSALLGFLAVKVVKPAPAWDKSLDAFQIPNHQSTINREKLDLAEKGQSTPSRARRSTRGPEYLVPAGGGESLSARDGFRKLSDQFAKRLSSRDKVKNRASQKHTFRNREQVAELPGDVLKSIPSQHLMDLSDHVLSAPTNRNRAKSDTLKNNHQKGNHINQKDGKHGHISDNHIRNNYPNGLITHTQNHQATNATQSTDGLANSQRGHKDHNVKEKSSVSTSTHDVRKRSTILHSRTHLWRLQLVYMAKGDDENIFTPERLQTIHNVEMSIMNHTNFTDFCTRTLNSWKDPALARYGHCLPPNSLMTYFYPSSVDNVIRYDGMGTELADLNGTLSMAMGKQTFYWFVDTHMNSKNRRSKFMRSEVWFGSPVGDGTMRSDLQHAAYKKFIYSYIKLLDKASTDKVNVLYGGTEIFDHEVSMTIYHDVLLSIPTFTAIFLLLLFFTSFSIWLTICGLLSIVYSFCCAYFCYHVFFRIEALGLLNVVSVFVIIGIGVDDVFVFVNTFRQADSIKDPAVRMGHTITTAGVATFFTSVTTAGAFGANMASQIPAIFDFGLFMMLLVLFCWLMVIAIMPPALNIWHQYLSCELHLMQKCKSKKSDNRNQRNTSLYRVLAQYENPAPEPSPEQDGTESTAIMVPRDRVLDDSDIPMLELEEDPEEEGLLTDDEDDVPLLQVSSNTERVSPVENKEAASLTSGLQKLLHRFVAIPVMKCRWIIIGLFCAILCVSIVLVSRLQPASRPPALYRPDTNLQRLLDLAYNFSGTDINCRKCSGFNQGQSHTIVPPSSIPIPPSHNPGVLTPHPPIPTHSPETTYWPPPPTPSETAGGGVEVVTAPTEHLSFPASDIGGGGDMPATTPNPENPTTPPPKSNPDGGGDGPIVDPSSPGKGFNPCSGNDGRCGSPARRPLLDDTATVFLVFGIKGIDKSNVSTHHVVNEEQGEVIYDTEFSAMRWHTEIALCKICKAIGNNRDLVKEGGAECFPSSFFYLLKSYGMQIPSECNDLPTVKLLPGQRSHAKVQMHGHDVLWFAMAFESKIYKGKSSFEAYKDYNAWEKAVKEVKQSLTEEELVGLESAFQTCDYWEQVFMEIIGVTSAIYGVAFSLIVCILAVALFTAHVTILVIAVTTIGGVILVVVSMFYLLGWQMGAVEAVSLSILVGSSIDYCIHLIEGFRVAANHVKIDSGEASKIRQERTIHSIRTIGVSILSSALTTIIAAIPLCFTTVQLFAKFGQIVAINTLVSILYTLTACAAFLGCFAPARYRLSVRWLFITLFIVGLLFGAGFLALYLLHQHGVTIPGPSGDTLFE